MTDYVYTPTVREMLDADATVLYTWRINGWDFSKDASFALMDPREKLKVDIPQTRFSRGTNNYSTFTFLNPGNNVVDEVVPLCYGRILQARAFLVDSVTKTFMVSANAVKRWLSFELDGVPFQPDSFNNGQATFVYSAYDVDAGAEVLVSFEALLDNPADVVEDLLTRGGVTDLYTPGSGDDLEGQGFGAYGSRTKWIRGTVIAGPDTGDELSLFSICLYLTGQDLFTVIEDVTAVAGGLFFVNPDGQFTLRAWEPRQAEPFERFLAEDGTLLDLSPTADAEEPVTKVIVSWNDPTGNGTPQTYIDENENFRRARGQSDHMVKEWDAPLWRKNDVVLLASRTLFMLGQPVRIWKATVSRKALGLQPGDGVWLTWDALGINDPFEVLGITYQPGSPSVELTLIDWRGFRDGAGFWVGDAEVAPSYYGGSSVMTWDEGSGGWNDEEMRYAQTNIGYWCDDSGFADPLQSVDSRLISRWV